MAKVGVGKYIKRKIPFSNLPNIPSTVNPLNYSVRSTTEDSRIQHEWQYVNVALRQSKMISSSPHYQTMKCKHNTNLLGRNLFLSNLKENELSFSTRIVKLVDLMVFPYFRRRQLIEWKTHISLFQGYKNKPSEQN